MSSIYASTFSLVCDNSLPSLMRHILCDTGLKEKRVHVLILRFNQCSYKEENVGCLSVDLYLSNSFLVELFQFFHIQYLLNSQFLSTLTCIPERHRNNFYTFSCPPNPSFSSLTLHNFGQSSFPFQYSRC